MAKLKDLSGNVYGRLTILEKIGTTNDGRAKWECKCLCGKIVIKTSRYLINGDTKSCGCLRRELMAKNILPITESNRTGTKNITGSYICEIKKSARNRELEYSLNKEYLQNLLEKQEFKCALSGIKLICEITNSSKNHNRVNNTASLDRIDSTKGYIEGNVQWVHKDINLSKQDMTDEDFINWCHLISTYQSSKDSDYNDIGCF